MIIVTGGAGFIGSNIAARLAEAGADVVVVDRFGTADLGKWRNLRMADVADLIDPADLFTFLDKAWRNVEAVVHMGAISSTTETDVDAVVEANFRLSRDIWDWCAARQRPLIYASSAATYGDGALGFTDANERDALRSLKPLNAYGWSKKAFDLYAARKAAAGHAPPRWSGLKFFNVYGPNEQHKGGQKSVVAHMHPVAVRGEPVRLFKSHHPDYADGGQLRDFVYVRDCVDVVAWLLEKDVQGGVLNVGSGKARTFADLAGALFAALGKKPAITYVDTPVEIRDKYQYFTQADMTRLRALGYERPFTAIETGVADYVATSLAHTE
jgi:ADP-L-glycero-D-manno-heptose 6-epimerase